MSAPGPEKAGGRVVLLLLLGLALLVGAGYAAAYAAAGDRVPRGTSVAGVEIGGQTPDEALALLEDDLADRAAAPIVLVVDDRRLRVDPARAGLTVDHEASVAAAGGGRSWAPSRLWDYYTGGDDLDAVVEVDDQALAGAVDDLASRAGTEPRDGAVGFTGTQVAVTRARPGRALDPEATAEALRSAYLADAPTQLTTVTAQPQIDDRDVSRAVEEFANPAMSAPVTILFEDSRVRLPPAAYAGALRMVPRDGELVPAVKRARLRTLVDREVSTNSSPVDARFRIVDGRPRVVPARPGVTYRPADLADTFLRAVAKDERRQGRVRSTIDRADFTTKEARGLGIRERVSTFTTFYPHADYRNVNLGRAGELIDGTVLEPGEVFSLNDTVGERTRANGFTEGFIISDGILVEDLGGGVSQMATTTFNAMFFAGLEDVEHKPHSFYIDRYPVGREATVAWGAVDLRFRNDTDHGVLVTADVAPSSPGGSGSVTVSMWSTETWNIRTRTGSRYNFTTEQTRRIDDRQCTANAGYGGFDIDVWRYFRRPGSRQLVRTEKFNTTYTPSDTVICTNPNATAG